LGLLSPESISEVEASLEIDFTKPNALELIRAVLVSSDLHIQQSATIFYREYLNIRKQTHNHFQHFIANFDDPLC
jgi:hypothetical protein